jgi:isopenicillin-N epimerase
LCGHQGIRNFPQDIKSLPRRHFIQQLIGGAAAVSFLPSLALADGKPALGVSREPFVQLPRDRQGDEKFWNLVKEHFMIRKDLIMMNSANMSPSPLVVQQHIFKYIRDLDADASYPNRVKFDDMKEKSREAVAQYLGAHPDEIAITRNTTEGNALIIAGLTFKPSDEVVIWDENHPTLNIAWDVRAERYGFSVKRVKVPPKPKNSGELFDVFKNALNRNTRIIAFSHVSNLTGIALPAKELCHLARERGILSFADGAQTFGLHQIDLHDMGCDFYTGSAHKWLCGPKEVGILYVRKERIDGLWPLIVGDGWEETEKSTARKFETQGQRDDARVSALGKTLEFHNLIGKEHIEARVRSLAAALKSEIQKKISVSEFVTPFEPELSSGIVVFSTPQVRGKDGWEAIETLYQKHGIGCAVFPEGIRLSPNIYNTMEEVEKAVAEIKNFS